MKNTKGASHEAALPRRRDSLSGSRLAPYLFSLPMIFCLTLFFLAPLLMLAAASLIEVAADGSRHLTLRVYANLLSDSYTLQVIWRTVKTSAIATFVSLILAFPVALHLRQMSPRWQSFVSLLLLSPLLTSVVVRTLAWVILLGPNGVINSALQAIGIGPFRLIYNDLGVIIGLTHVFLGFMVLALMTSVSKIPDNLLYAASNLGANRVQLVLKVMLPLSLPGMLAGSVLVFSMAASTYATPVLLGGSASKVVAAEIYDRALTYMEFSDAAALSVILFALVAFCIIGGTWLAERGRNRVIFE